MYYTRLQVVCDPEFSEILMAEIAESGFDSFLETEHGFEAYTEKDNFDAEHLESIRAKYQHVNPLIFYQDKIQKKNWNEEWEKNLKPVIVDDQVIVRAEFHQIDRSFPHEIIITPKMSFGTGHHQTTYLMIKNQLKVDHMDKRVMDAGCGTAILSIMASKLGAREIEAFDIDEWSVINGEENKLNNLCTNIRLQQGKLSELDIPGEFEILLANINKNVLLEEIPSYSKRLVTGGHLMLSGFYEYDVDDLLKLALREGLRECHRDQRETWALLLLQKE